MDALPLSHLAGCCRNETEARTLIDCDIRDLDLEITLDHLLACAAYEKELADAHAKILAHASTPGVEPLAPGIPTGSLNSAAAVVGVGLEAMRTNIRELVARADDLLREAAEAQPLLARYAEANQSLCEELGEQSPLWAAKRKLWLAEECLAARTARDVETLRRLLPATLFDATPAVDAGS